jgi:hypothetical protein
LERFLSKSFYSEYGEGSRSLECVLIWGHVVHKELSLYQLHKYISKNMSVAAANANLYGGLQFQGTSNWSSKKHDCRLWAGVVICVLFPCRHASESALLDSDSRTLKPRPLDSNL